MWLKIAEQYKQTHKIPLQFNGKYAIIVMVNVMKRNGENIMDRRFLEKEIEQLEVGKLYSSQWNGDFFFKEMRNDYLATFVKAVYAEEDELLENPLMSNEFMYATPSECKREGWIK